MVQQKKGPSHAAANGANKRDQSNMSFQKKDSSDARVMAGKGDGKAPNGNGAATFRTDGAISSGRAGGPDRELQRWVPDSSDTFDHTLEKSTGSGAWDQFAENERLFGLKTNYDENFYTTQIDKSHPQYRERMIAAEKKAREIERSAAATAHVAEERVMDHVGGSNDKADEEDKYSGVKRQDFPPLPGSRENKYTPPARRAPTGSATVKGAPVDPAIISSQLRNPKGQAAAKVDDAKARAASKNDASATPPISKTSNTKPETKTDSQPKATESKPSNQNSIQLKPSAAAIKPIPPQAKEGAPSATSTVERDVLKEFKTFANQQRMNAAQARSTKAKADKEVKLTELRKFADSFKLPTPVPVDLISIIAKDPAKQREIQQKAQRDAEEVKKRKAEEAVAKEKKTATSKEPQPAAASQAPSDNRTARPTAPATTHAAASGGAQGRHQGNRQSYAPQYSQFQGNRAGPQHMPQAGRQGGGLSARIRNLDQQKMHSMPPTQDMRMPPTGPANGADPSFGRRMGVPGHMGGKLNPNSHEFRPGSFAPSFGPNGHPSTTSSPRSNVNNGMEPPSANTSVPLVVITKKRKAVDANKCVILSYVKTLKPPENKNWNDNDGIPPSYDTSPTWRSFTDDEKPDSTMRLSYNEYFERQPFNPQPTPNTTHAVPHIAHQHQLPFHLQHGAHNMGPRHSPHVPPVQMHGGAQHGPVPHAPFNGPDDHRMMPSSSSQSFSSPRMNPVPMAAYPPAMNSPAQMPYNQPAMPSFMGPGQPQMNQFGRSFSNNGSYMPQQPGNMSGQMLPPQFMTPQGMVAVPPQMQMYQPGHPQFIPPGATPPQPMPAANGYPSPGRPAAPMMVHQGSQQGQPMYNNMSPAMQYQVPAFSPQQQGQINMRGYSNPGPQQFGTSPSQMHQYGPPHRNGNNNYNKGYQGHNHQHQGPQGNHPIPTGPQGRNPDGSDETK